MQSESRSRIETLFCKSGFQLSSRQLDQFIYYLQQLQIWNRKINLTRIDDVDGIVRKHFLDSLQLLELESVQAMLVDRQSGCRLIDIGSGAGFPGLPLKIYRPQIELVLVESVIKKASFLQYISAQLSLSAVQVIAERAKHLSGSAQGQHGADLVVTRYVASLQAAAIYCLPLVKSDGRWIAYKSGQVDDIRQEIYQAESVLSALGAKVVQIWERPEHTGNRSKQDKSERLLGYSRLVEIRRYN